jgi:hypothetical protein
VPVSARTQPRLVVVVGPIAAGKSTLAAEVAQRLRGRGESVVVAGLDEVAEMALPTLDDWAWAHEVHGRLVGAWLATPVQRVVAEGPATPAELERLMRSVPADVGVVTVVLVTSYATALSRAAGDPGRGLSKDPDFLGRQHARFQRGLPHLVADLVLDSTDESAATLAGRVVVALDERAAGHPGG